ncbi:MAG: cobalamin-independent methionine synthase II family protein, partial [Xanthobacteraceae bacterium]
MKHSTDRILTTHAGSLPRPPDLLDLVQAGGAKAFDQDGNAARLRSAVSEIVHKQTELGIDVIDDGEYGKPSFVSYINERLGGYEVDTMSGPRNQWMTSREGLSFPEFYAQTHPASTHTHMVCTGPVTYNGHARLQRDIDNLKAALIGVKPEEVFMPAISPSNIEDWQKNAYYKSQEEYVFAIADAMREEYKAIVDAGFLVQIDDPRLVTYYIIHPETSIADCRKWAEIRVEALNHALRDIAPEKIRFHTCYGINMGPRVHDMELKDIVDIILKIRAGAYSFEAANPRHEHEWKVWKDVKLPDGKILIPGVVSHASNVVEHPELVADRLVLYAGLVGRENVIGGTDCGLGLRVHPQIAWAKLKA